VHLTCDRERQRSAFSTTGRFDLYPLTFENAATMSESLHPDELRRFAVELAHRGGRAADRLFGKVSVRRKPDKSPVTEADHIAQDAILRAIAERFPDHAVLVEETLADPSRHGRIKSSPYCWVVDPLDGTRNFARGIRIYACSIAVLYNGRPIAGAIYDASSGVMYSAASGGGALRNEDRILLDGSVPAISTHHAANVAPLVGSDRETTIAVGSFRRKPMPPFVRDWIGRYLIRNMGSTSLHFAWIAAGLVDAAYTNECKLWDIAAAALLIEESGGLMTTASGASPWPVQLDAYGGEDFNVLGGARAIHHQLLTDMRGHDPS